MRPSLWLLALVACGGAPPAAIAHHAPAPIAPPSYGRDPLAFLEGCWSEWSVDWGFDICWKRAGEARWLGSSRSQGPMGKHWDIGFEIKQRADEFYIQSMDHIDTWWDHYDRVRSTSASGRTIRFGKGGHVVRFWRIGDDLGLGVDVVDHGKPYHFEWTMEPRGATREAP